MWWPNVMIHCFHYNNNNNTFLLIRAYKYNYHNAAYSWGGFDANITHIAIAKSVCVDCIHEESSATRVCYRWNIWSRVGIRVCDPYDLGLSVSILGIVPIQMMHPVGIRVYDFCLSLLRVGIRVSTGTGQKFWSVSGTSKRVFRPMPSGRLRASFWHSIFCVWHLVCLRTTPTTVIIIDPVHIMPPAISLESEPLHRCVCCHLLGEMLLIVNTQPSTKRIHPTISTSALRAAVDVNANQAPTISMQKPL